MMVPNTTAEVTPLPEGGCQMLVTSQNNVCRQVLIESVLPNTAKTGWQIRSQGITECFPEGCSFASPAAARPADGGDADAEVPDGAPSDGITSDGAAGDATPNDARAGDGGAVDGACRIGDRAGTRLPDSIVMSGDVFVATAPAALGICRPYGLPQVTNWQRLQ